MALPVVMEHRLIPGPGFRFVGRSLCSFSPPRVAHRVDLGGEQLPKSPYSGGGYGIVANRRLYPAKRHRILDVESAGIR